MSRPHPFPNRPSTAQAYASAPAIYHYLLARQERSRWVDRLVWPYGPALLALGTFLEIAFF